MSRLTLNGALLLDGTGEAPVREAYVALEGDRIVEVGRGRAPAGGVRLDLGGLCLLPGLINCGPSSS